MLDIIIQGRWIFGVTPEWIYKYSLHNSFLLWCFAEGIFGESKLLGWLALFGMLAFIILLIYTFLIFIRKKENFLIPLFLMLLNVIVHIVFYWKTPFSYVGLLYKIIGCVIFAKLHNRGTTRHNNQHQSGDGSLIDNSNTGDGSVC